MSIINIVCCVGESIGTYRSVSNILAKCGDDRYVSIRILIRIKNFKKMVEIQNLLENLPSLGGSVRIERYRICLVTVGYSVPTY